MLKTCGEIESPTENPWLSRRWLVRCAVEPLTEVPAMWITLILFCGLPSNFMKYLALSSPIVPMNKASRVGMRDSRKASNCFKVVIFMFNYHTVNFQALQLYFWLSKALFHFKKAW